MHFYAPERPRISGIPTFLPEGGCPLCVLPSFYIRSRENGDVEVSFFISVGGNRSGRFERKYELEEIQPLLSRYLEDPEKVIIEEFGWKLRYESKGASSDTKPALSTDLNNLLNLL